MKSQLSIITVKLNYLKVQKDPAENKVICELIIFGNAYYKRGINEKETELNLCG